MKGEKMREAHLSLKNTTKYYKNVKAVDNISLDVYKGEFLTILGPSGSGKTSLLKLIAGFEELSEGEIYLNGEEISKKKSFERNIGMLFQNYALFPHMTVEQNVAYPLKLRKMNKAEIAQKVKNVLEMVHLEDFAKRYPHQLSGGQQQRVALARAIVFNPPLLLLDEPLGALDKNLRKTMQFEIKQLQQQTGITTITVTHDQEEALTMSDRVCIMNQGKIEQIASPVDIYQKPINKFVAKFIGEINLLPGEVVSKSNSQVTIKIINEPNLILQSQENEDVNGKDVYLAIRPENIKIIHENQDAVLNKVQVNVEEVIFVGEILKVKTRTSSGNEIMFNLDSNQMYNIQTNDEITIGWNIDESIVIPREHASV